MTRSCSRVQQGLTIIPLRTNRNTDRKQKLYNPGVSCPCSRVQQGSAIGTSRKKDPCHVHMTQSCSRVQWGLTIIPLRINRDTDRKQYPSGTHVPFDSCRVQ